MSSPTYVVIPVQGDGAQRSEQDNEKITAAIQQSLHDNNHSGHPGEGQTGPLTEILAHQDSLYKYISWEDPIRTLLSYLGALSVLLGAHYLPLTQLALKAGAVTLGVVSVTEFAGRSFGSNSLLARLRPKEYKKVPEATLNATLKDVHDLVQYGVVQAQRVIYGQDLDKTFAAFLSFTALFWLIKVLSPFSLAVLGLTSLFIAPLVASPRGRAVARDAKARAGELTNSAVVNGKALAQDGAAKVAEQSANARDTAASAGRRLGDMAVSGKQTAVDMSSHVKGAAVDLSNRAGNSAADTSSRAKGTAVDMSNQARGTASDMSSRAKGTAADVSNQARDTAHGMSNQARGTASGIYEATAETGRQLPGRAADAGHQAADVGHQAAGTYHSTKQEQTGYPRTYEQDPRTQAIPQYGRGV